MSSRRSASVIVADIGGTNCRFQVWQLDDVLRPSRLALEKVRGIDGGLYWFDRSGRFEKGEVEVEAALSL